MVAPEFYLKDVSRAHVAVSRMSKLADESSDHFFLRGVDRRLTLLEGDGL